VTDSEGLVLDIQRFSIHDGPGIRTTVFLKGCPLTCAWCHNPESQSFVPELLVREGRCVHCGACVAACPRGALGPAPAAGGAPRPDRARCDACGTCAEACPAGARGRAGRRMTVAEVMDEVERDRPFYEVSGGGVTFSGGEPLAQPAFLAALLRAARARDLATALDTCGHAPWETLDALRGDVDLFLYDLKLMDDGRHRALTGVSNATLLANLRALSERGHRIVVRVPVIEGVHDDPAALDELFAFAAALPKVEAVELLRGHRLAAGKYERLGRPAPATGAPGEEHLAALAERGREHRLAVDTGGR
jgi:pyruvate formate lyase activating enzyme